MVENRKKIFGGFLAIASLMMPIGMALSVWTYFEFEELFEEIASQNPYIAYDPDAGISIAWGILLSWLPLGLGLAYLSKKIHSRASTIVVLSSILVPIIIGSPGTKHKTDSAFVAAGYQLCEDYRGHNTYRKRRSIYRWQVWVLDPADCFLEE